MGKDEESALKFTIDGEEVEYIRGQTILEAAENAGIYIPNLCVIKELSPFGACRLCTVKIVGARKPFVTACSTPAIQNIEVINNSEELQEMRSDIIQMMLSEHPNACLICGHNSVCPDYNSDSKEKAGRIFGCFSCPSKNICQLKSVVKSLDITKLKYDYEYKDLSFENEDPFFDRDYNLCVLCGRCVRVCNELRGIGAIHFMNRGHDTKVSTAGDLMQKESNCIFCGSCVDTCPTGALSLKTNKWIKREECNYIESICGICSLCCEFDYYVSQNGEFESIPKTQACIIGRFCTSKFNNHKDRLKEPLMKKYGKLAPVKWEEAYEKILENFKKFKPNEIAFLV
ncbi:MAG: 4Fe-4S dicluster domain-containing protein, partial [archaeon]|nr:4Fe-4S dicluster domain-containing protein [archaeon]